MAKKHAREAGRKGVLRRSAGEVADEVEDWAEARVMLEPSAATCLLLRSQPQCVARSSRLGGERQSFRGLCSCSPPCGTAGSYFSRQAPVAPGMFHLPLHVNTGTTVTPAADLRAYPNHSIFPWYSLRNRSRARLSVWRTFATEMPRVSLISWQLSPYTARSSKAARCRSASC